MHVMVVIMRRCVSDDVMVTIMMLLAHPMERKDTKRQERNTERDGEINARARQQNELNESALLSCRLVGGGRGRANKLCSPALPPLDSSLRHRPQQK